MASIFSKIIAGEIPSYKVAENDKFYAFLDINPLQKGHTLVVPKKEIDYIFDIDDQDLGEMMVFAKKVARAIKAAIPCVKVGVAVIGLEVRHAHIHLVPMDKEGDISFAKPKMTLPADEMEAIAKSIAAHIE
ncbi:MAG TPA: HIT family protein [Candidatus Avibacteroides faecavium]|nr:HIT family protein [Candidatus Avibacteroides faecavium]